MQTLIAGARKVSDFNLFLAAVRNASFSVTAVFAGLGCDSVVGQKLARHFHLPFRSVSLECLEEGSQELLQDLLSAGQVNAVVALWDGSNPEVHHILTQAQKDGLRVQIVRAKPWIF